MLASGKVSQESESWTGEDVMCWWEVMTECDKCHPGVTPRDTLMMSHSPAPAPRRGFRAALDPINIMRWQKEEKLYEIL